MPAPPRPPNLLFTQVRSLLAQLHESSSSEGGQDLTAAVKLAVRLHTQPHTRNVQILRSMMHVRTALSLFYIFRTAHVHTA